jgi:transcriptional regulator with XRE-family HTH domain
LLAQVADFERGERIKAAREARHLTQPAVVEKIEEEARKLPPDHDLRRRLEDHGELPITLRGFQSWQYGGGIDYEKAKLLAKVLHVTTDWIFNGDEEDQPTPDPFVPTITGELAGILQAIKDQLAEQTA